jgi:hypothetical protein
MGDVLSFPAAQSLDPDGALIAAAAFDAALRYLAAGRAVDPSIRYGLARYIVDRAFRGERDVRKLRDDALARFGWFQARP